MTITPEQRAIIQAEAMAESAQGDLEVAAGRLEDHNLGPRAEFLRKRMERVAAEINQIRTELAEITP